MRCDGDFKAVLVPSLVKRAGTAEGMGVVPHHSHHRGEKKHSCQILPGSPSVQISFPAIV